MSMVDHQSQLANERAWFCSDLFDVDAKAYGASDRAHLKLLLQALVEKRFRLVTHHETRQLPVLNLTVSPKGIRMKRSAGPLQPEKPQTSVAATIPAANSLPIMPA